MLTAKLVSQAERAALTDVVTQSGAVSQGCCLSQDCTLLLLGQVCLGQVLTARGGSPEGMVRGIFSPISHSRTQSG